MKVHEWDVSTAFFFIARSVINAQISTVIGTDWGFYGGVLISFLMFIPALIVQHKFYYYHKYGDSKRIKILLWLAFEVTYFIALELSARIVGGFNYFYYFSNFKYDFAVLELLAIVITLCGYDMYLNIKEKKTKEQTEKI